ncbi:MAG: DUF5591 domain-containing protein [Thermoplasmata archaeon]|nr:MAG: DUF5591 domain-containing protein [Thermoplasmata archaeon]
MPETTARDGLARIQKWEHGKSTEGKAEGIATPELLFVQTPRIPVPEEARTVITADPSLSETPVIYHRGNVFSPRAVLDEGSSTSKAVKGALMAQIPPFQWLPVGISGYLKGLEIESAEFFSESKPSKGFECGDMDNVRVIYESSMDEDLKSCSTDKNIDLVVLGNSMELFSQPRRFTEIVIKLKKELGQRVIIYTPALGEPSHMALLAYMGIDLMDTLPLVHYARDNILLTPSTKIRFEDAGADWYCTCMFCKEWQSGGSKDAEFPLILGHNYSTALQELSLVRQAIRVGSLRELVEARIAVQPRAINILRFLDSLHFDYIEEFTPIARKTVLIASTLDSLSRPEVVRFRKRIQQRYIKPDFAKVLLLLPCSARKPYSSSPSHQAFMFALKNCKNPMVVHEVIVTSPLGIVPRELELAYPAQHYDIPVTGTWYEEEKAAVRTQLNWLLENFEYSRIVAHLDNEHAFLVDGLEHVELTGGEKATSKSSLAKLTETLNDAVLDCPEISPKKRRHQMLTALAMFQFGADAGRALTEGAEFRGNYPYLKILHTGSQLGMIEGSTGLISLTLAGGERILASGAYGVEIEDFQIKGDIFAPGVRDADLQIRTIDEVVVFCKNGNGTGKKLKAVGRAAMPGVEMKDAEKGRAVKVRHYVK